jgi:hypothetical protein
MTQDRIREDLSEQEHLEIMVGLHQEKTQWFEGCHAMAINDGDASAADFYNQPMQTEFVESLLGDGGGFSAQSSSSDFAKQFRSFHKDLKRVAMILGNLLVSGEGPERSEEENSEEADFMTEFSRLDTLFTYQLALSAKGRSYCRTSDGRVGWVPKHSKVGDKMCLLFGGKVLHTLRADGDGRYQLIGEAYVQGLMQGEGLEIEGIDAQDIHIR